MLGSNTTEEIMGQEGIQSFWKRVLEQWLQASKQIFHVLTAMVGQISPPPHKARSHLSAASLLFFLMALPHPAELTLLVCKLSDMTELSLGMALLGTVLFMGHVFLKWHICFAQYLQLMVARLSAWATRCIQLLKVVVQLHRWQVDSFASFSWP